MRAVTIAAAGAALTGTVSASSHVQLIHKQLHARSAEESTTWPDWSSSSADPTTAPSTEASWGDWSTSSPDVATSTDPSVTWEDWSTTSTPDVATSTDPSVTWEDWSTTSTPDVATSTDPSVTWEDWSTSTPDVATSTDPATTWEDWSTSSDPDVATSTTETWGDWAESKSGTTTTTVYLGKATDPSTTWEDWSTSSTPDGATSDPTDTWADWSSYSTPAASVVTSSVAPVWSSDGWFGPGWNTDPGQCAVQVVTSYGSPTWAPTPTLPVLSVTVTPTAADGSTTWADWTSSDPADSSTSTETWADWSSTDPAAASTTSWADWSASSTPADGSASSTSWADWSSPTGGLSSSGNTWGITYSPYTSGGGCKDAGTVASDIAIIKSKGFSTVRVYSTDCSTLENVGNAARDNGLKLILGVFISSTGIEGSKEQVWDIVGWKQWDLVELIVIGNEAVFNGYASASDLAAYITESEGYFKQYGYTGPVTTTEPLAEWQKDGSTLCSVVDVVAANLYAFFNPQTTADKAGDFIQAEIEELSGICPGKATYVMESGWPSAGDCNGAACPSPENQATAIKSIESVTGSKVIFFSYEDEAWKQPGQFNVEQHWGCINVF